MHLAGLYDGTSWRLYKNGVEIGSNADGTGAVSVAEAWAIGSTGTGSERFFGGEVDEVRIYNRALSVGEIAVLASADAGITDVATNPLDGDEDGAPGPDYALTFTIDKPPRVVSITRVGAALTNADAVDFTVTFDQDVTGVDAGDFALYAPDTATGNIAGVVGIGTTWTVSVDTITGDGTLGLDLVDNDTILDGSLVPLAGAADGSYSSGEAYTIDKTPPNVVSITLDDPDPTNATNVNFVVTFDSEITGVMPFDFVEVLSGTTGSVFSGAPLSSTSCIVNVAGVSGNGTLGLNLEDDDGITDLAGNPLGGVGIGNGDFTTGDFYTIDTDPPGAPSVTGTASPTNNDTPTWDWSQGAPAGDGTFQYQLDSESAGGWTETAALTWTPGAALPDGTRTVYVQERDAATNWSVSGSYAIDIDTTPPTVTVDPLTTNDRSPPLTGTVDDIAAAISVTVGGTTYPAINNGDGTWTLADGDITPDLAEATHDVQVTATDALLNSASDGTMNELVIDITPPAVTVDPLLTNDDTPELTGTVDDPAATVEVTVASQTFTATNNGDGTWTLADETLVAIGAGTFDVLAEATDAAGNVGTDGTLGELVVDLTGPQVTGVTPAPGAILNVAPTTVVVTFEEPMDAATVDASSFRLVASGGDGTFGDGNEVVIAPDSATLTSPGVAEMDITSATLVDEVYQVTVGASGGRGALAFDGVDDFVTCSQWLQGTGSQVTFEVWCKPLADGFGNMVLHRADFNDVYFTWDTPSKSFAFAIPLDQKVVYSGPELVLGQWYHVAGTYDGATVKLYINGELKGTRSVSKSINFNSGYFGSYIGGSGYSAWGGRFPGELDEVRVWTVARTQAELQASMYERLTGTEPGLVGYYNFDELGGQTAFDSSPAGNDGQLGPTGGNEADDPAWVLSTAPVVAAVTDLAGNALDGEYVPAAFPPSGDGTAGGDFVVTFTLDTTPPTVTVDPLLTNDTTPALSGSIDDPTATIQVTVDGNSYPATNNGATWTLADGAISVPLADGTYDVQVAATDGAGNVGTDLTAGELVVDTTPPAVTVDALATTDTTPALSGTIDDSTATVQVTVDSNIYAAINNGGTWTLAEDVISPALAVGTYDVLVTATDAAGNTGTDVTINELVVSSPPDDPGACGPGSGAMPLALLLPLALALVLLRRRARRAGMYPR